VTPCERAAADPGVAVLVLTGAGSAFSAGGNLNGMRDRNGIGPLGSPLETRANYQRGIQRIPLALWHCEIPTIAAINGHAIGVGLDLACMCDIALPRRGAKLAASFVRMGIVPGDGGAYFLPRAVGLAKAAEMLFTGEAIGGDEALACGLVSRTVPADSVLAERRRWPAASPRTRRRRCASSSGCCAKPSTRACRRCCNSRPLPGAGPRDRRPPRGAGRPSRQAPAQFTGK
jgi:enoyl-CoA hydratase/carnithine racemase